MAWCRAALVGGNLSDSACLFLNNDHLSSLTVLIVAFSWYSWQTNCSIPSTVSSSSFSSLPRLAKDVRIDSFASSNYFQQVGFPFPEKLPVLSAPVKAWNASNTAVLSVLADPRASKIGCNLIVRRVVADPVAKRVFGHRCAKERCSMNRCQCCKAGLLCTDLCSCSDDDDDDGCENQQGEWDDDDSDIEDEDDDDDSLN